MKVLIFILTTFVVISLATPVFSQTQERISANVVHDPLFWRGALSLTPAQCSRIRDINADFYRSVIESRSTDSKSANNLEQLLEIRSELIWSIFSSRQKAKWRKLQEAFESPQARRNSVG